MKAFLQTIQSPRSLITALALFLFISGNVLAAQPEGDSLAWDCWVQENSSPVSISCISDRDNLPPQSVGDLNNLEELLLDHIHHQIHAGHTTDLGQFISNNVKVFRNDSIWSIHIYSVPYESSWKEGYPETLVRALLCPGHLTCTVVIKQP